MNLKIKKNIFRTALFAMIIVVIYIVISKISNFSTNNVWFNEKNNNSDTMENESQDKDKKIEGQINENESPLRLYEVNDEVNFGSYTYKVNSVISQKKRGDFPAPIYREIYSFDENGELLGEESYILVNISLINNEEETSEFYLNTMNLAVLKDVKTRVCDYCECVSATKIEGYGRKDFFKVELDPKTEYNYDLVFIAPDASIANNEAQLVITRQRGYTAKNNEDKYRYIQLKFD